MPTDQTAPVPPSSSLTLAKATTIARAWLRMDFFGTGDGSGQDAGSALTSTIFSQSFFAFLLAALLFGPDTQPVAYVAANLSLSTLLVGIGALADPQRALRRRKADAALLLPAPLPRATIAAARAMHGIFYTALITLGMAIPPAILCFWVFDGWWPIVPLYLLAACGMSGLCAGALSVTLRVVERLVGRGASMLTAGTVRAVLLGGGLVGFALCLRLLDGTASDVPLGPASAWCWPPYWCARTLAPGGDAVALIALIAITLAVVTGGALLPEVDAPRSRRIRVGRRSFLATLETKLTRGMDFFGCDDRRLPLRA